MNVVKNNQYRFKLINGVDSKRINPLGTISVTNDLVEGTFFYQQNIGSFKVNGEDYDWVKDIEDTGVLCDILFIEVEKKCGGVWSLYAKSQWTIQNCEFNNSKCNITIHPDSTGGGQCLLDRVTDEIDMFQAVDDTPLGGSDGIASMSDIDDGDSLNYSNGRAFFYTGAVFEPILIRPAVDVGGNPTLPPEPEEFTGLVGEEEIPLIQITRLGTVQTGILSPVFIIYVAWAYRRTEFKIGGENPVTPKGYSILNDTVDPVVYQKKPTDEDMTCFLTGGGFFGDCSVIAAPTAEMDIIYQNAAAAADPAYPAGFCAYIPHKDRRNIYVTLSLERVLQEFADRCGIPSVISDFFQINPENPSAINYVTGDATTTNDIRFIQKSNAIFPLLSNARTGSMSWDDLSGILLDSFQCFWTIDVNGNLRYEHISFYDNVVIGLDLTQPKFAEFVNGRINYSYKKELLPYIERVADDGNHHNYNWDQRDIKYVDPNDDKLSCVGTTDMERTLGIFTTDLDYYIEYPTEIPRDGWVMVSCAVDGSNPYVTDFDGFPNGNLSIKRLVDRYYYNNRSALVAQVNGVDVIFDTTKKIKEEDGLGVPICCDDNFDPRKNIKTPNGIGRIIGSEHNLKTNKLTLKSEY